MPSILVTGNQIVCEGDNVLLTATSTSISPQYSWTPSSILSSNTGNLVYANPLNDVTVYVTITDNNFCLNNDSILLHWIQLGIPPNLMIVGNSIVVTGNTQQLSWYLNDSLIANFTNDTLVNPMNGSYIVQSIDSNGCSVSSTAIVYSINGISDHVENNSAVFYTDGMVHLKWKEGNPKNTSLKLFDVSGRLMYQQSIVLNSDGVGETSFKNSAKGIYFILLLTNGNQKTFKFVVD